MNRGQRIWYRIGLLVVSSAILLFLGKAGLGLGTKIESLVPIRFNNVAAGAGLNFVLENHPTRQKHLIETMPGGVAAFDYDGDGLSDIYFTNGAAIPSLEKESPKYFNRLFRNQGGMKFADVTDKA